jgi:glutathione synthase/RimK-type ligase-like ATP-grasp enzyme
MTIRLWCYNDAHNWGSMLHAEATKRGHDAHLFDDARQPDQGYVFMHMHHHPQVRLVHKRIMAIMAMNPALTLVPEYRSSVLYDDKIEQARQLARWMPRTNVFHTPGAARRYLDKAPELPFMSKASEGASSHNVRLVSTYDEARLEIKHAFSDLGIKCRYGQTQRGYLMWQDFIPGNAGDIRVIAIGTKRLLLRRGNRDDRPMASGSGRIEAVTNAMLSKDTEAQQALIFANRFFAQENLNWCGIDLVKDATNRWYVLETTVGWTLNGYYDCEFVGTKLKGDRIWSVFLDEVEAGVFDFRDAA